MLPILHSLQLSKLLAAQFNQLLWFLVGGMNYGAAVSNKNENVFGQNVIFILKSSEGIKQIIVCLLFNFVEVLSSIILRDVNQLFRI
jgi:hypothetical protein